MQFNFTAGLENGGAIVAFRKGTSMLSINDNFKEFPWIFAVQFFTLLLCIAMAASDEDDLLKDAFKIVTGEVGSGSEFKETKVEQMSLRVVADPGLSDWVKLLYVDDAMPLRLLMAILNVYACAYQHDGSSFM